MAILTISDCFVSKQCPLTVHRTYVVYTYVCSVCIRTYIYSVCSLYVRMYCIYTYVCSTSVYVCIRTYVAYIVYMYVCSVLQ